MVAQSQHSPQAKALFEWDALTRKWSSQEGYQAMRDEAWAIIAPLDDRQAEQWAAKLMAASTSYTGRIPPCLDPLKMRELADSVTHQTDGYGLAICDDDGVKLPVDRRSGLPIDKQLVTLVRARASGRIGLREYITQFNDCMTRLGPPMRPIDGFDDLGVAAHPNAYRGCVDLLPEPYWAYWRERGIDCAEYMTAAAEEAKQE